MKKKSVFVRQLHGICILLNRIFFWLKPSMYVKFQGIEGEIIFTDMIKFNIC